MKIIVTPVGLSLFSNFFDPDKGRGSEGLKQHFKTLQDNRAEQAPQYARQIEKLRQGVVSSGFACRADACAEISSVPKIVEELKKTSLDETDFQVQLIASDTALSCLAAKIISSPEVCNTHFKNMTVCFDETRDVIKGLLVTEKQSFEEEGLGHLFHYLTEINTGDKTYEDVVVLNISGGYKGAIPYLTIFGQVYNPELFYMFEGSQDLIEIPRLPVDYDFTLFDEYYEALKLLEGDQTLNTAEFKQGLSKGQQFQQTDLDALEKEKHVIIKDGKIRLTIIGKLLLKRYKDLYGKGIRNNITRWLSDIIELKVYKYYVERYADSSPERRVTHDKEFKKDGQKVLEADVFIESEREIVSVEVKPLKRLRDIRKKFEKPAFKYLLEKFPDKKVILEFVLYSHIGISESVLEKMRSMNAAHHQDFGDIRWRLLDLSIGDYRRDRRWNVDANTLKKISL